MPAPRPRLRCPLLPFYATGHPSGSQPCSSNGPRRRPRVGRVGPATILSPDGGLVAPPLGRPDWWKAVYSRLEVASPPLCAQDLTFQDAWLETPCAQTVVPSPAGTDLGPEGTRGAGRGCKVPVPLPCSPPHPRGRERTTPPAAPGVVAAAPAGGAGPPRRRPRRPGEPRSQWRPRRCAGIGAGAGRAGGAERGEEARRALSARL